MLIAAAAAFGLVAARIMLGRGAAIIAALLAIGLRGGVALIVGPILGAPINWFALYLGPAIVVELIALTPLIKRPIIFGAVSGLGVATDRPVAGVALGRRGLPLSVADQHLARSARDGDSGRRPHRRLRRDVRHRPHVQRLPSRAISIGLVALTVLAIGGATANGLRYTVPQDVTATITLTDVPDSSPGQRMVDADVQINPPNLVSDDPNWVSVLGWQGGLANQRGEVVTNLEKLGPGHYRTTEPVPVWGTWKTLLRRARRKDVGRRADLSRWRPRHRREGGARAGIDDSAVRRRDHDPAARAQSGHAEVLWTIGGLVVLACTLVLIGGLSWGAGRINRSEPSGSKAELQPTAQA